MSRKSLAKTVDEVYMDLFRQYREKHGGSVRMEDVAQWIASEKLLPKPEVSAVRVHTRKLKAAARKARTVDPKGRKVRTLVAAKFERIEAGGQRVFDLVWDYLHDSSSSHLLTHFHNREDVIEKQKKSASRDWHSACDFNPNMQGLEGEYQFTFLTDDEPVEQITESLSETPVVPPAVPTLDDEESGGNEDLRRGHPR